VCSEPYVQEASVIDQCLQIVGPYGLTPAQADHVRALIDQEGQQEGQSLEATTTQFADGISTAQEKLNKLTRGYIDGLIDEESYQANKADLVLEKTRLKKEKERLSRTRSNYWNEPAKAVITALELSGKSQSEKSPQEISQVVHKVGTNRLISRKTVSFSFSEDYDFLPSLLASRRVATSNPSLSLCDENMQSSIWCVIVDHLRTHFSQKYVSDGFAEAA
jgi:hypothetical protein